jgi:hypothetical protein
VALGAERHVSFDQQTSIGTHVGVVTGEATGAAPLTAQG